MTLYRCWSADEAYTRLVDDVLHRGFSNMQRSTRELDGVLVELPNLEYRLIQNAVRALSPVFLLKEFLWIFDGRDDVFSPTMKKWAVKDESHGGAPYLPGAYGDRIRHWAIEFDQLQNVIDLLNADIGSRRACINIFDSADDANTTTTDAACNCFLQYIVTSDGELDGHVYARSIDLNTGFPYDIFHWASLIQYVASKIGVVPGTLHYYIANCHIYERDVPRMHDVRMSVNDHPAAVDPMDDSFIADCRTQIESGFLYEIFRVMDARFRALKQHATS